MNFREQIIKRIGNGLEESDIEIPPNPEMGDFAVPCFKLSKTLKKAPAQIAKELSESIKTDAPIKSVQALGPYINITIEHAALAEAALSTRPGRFSKEKVMVEYSSPNTNKPLHLGHLRNIVLGKSVSNILKSSGDKVIQACLVNDRGVHIMKSMLAYQMAGEPEPDKKTDHFVGDYYVKFNELAKKDESLNLKAQEMLQRWEKGDKGILKLWKRMNSWAEEGFNQTYGRLGIRFDKLYHESKIYDKGKDIVVKGLKKGIFKEKDGAIIAELGKLPDKVLVRADGTTLYMTQDIYLAGKKFEDYGLDRSIYVVGSEQNNHFQQLFRILEMIGEKSASRCFHLSYGMVNLPEGKMKSREGTVVDADDILDQMIGLARAEVEKRYKLSEKDIVHRAKVIGLGALKFFLLRMDPAKDMIFDPKESISFEGETGPYVQYTYARLSSIVRKAGKMPKKADYSILNEERNLFKHVLNMDEVIRESKRSLKPSLICRFLLDLCQATNEYYHGVPVLKAEDKLRDSRLIVLDKVRGTIKRGLSLLDIDVLEEM